MSDDITPAFHGLLYIDEQESTHSNLRGGGDPIDVYVRCAALCAASVRYHGYSFQLVTNRRARIESRLAALGIQNFEIAERPFTLDVPKGVEFYAAHFKLELYAMFGAGMFGSHVGVIDIDTVMTAPINFPSLAPGVLLGYDITDQVSVKYGIKRICSDLERVGGSPVAKCRWFGGEFLFGHAESFRLLSDAISRLWPRYIKEIEGLHHVGDEMLVSAAVPTVDDLEVLDAGKQGLIARWWTASTGHRQPTFSAIKDRSILHLPSDKPFLAASAETEFNPVSFIAAFEKHAGGKLFRRRPFSLASRLLNGEQNFVARLR